MAQASNLLRIGSKLEEYVIEAVLGAGGFGVTYKAQDTHLNIRVAIKEYFPLDWSYRSGDGVNVHPNTQGQAPQEEILKADYRWGLERFLDEAQALALIRHPYVVRVNRYFRANGTAYIVMDYEEGMSLNLFLAGEKTLPERAVWQLLKTVLPALRTVHEHGYLHRDIKPGNLYLRTHDQAIMLIDFGAAREVLRRSDRTLTRIVTPGYSPPEQYVARQSYPYGPWTDIYPLGAVLYRCITGLPPLDAAERLLGSPLKPVAGVEPNHYSPVLLEVVDRALALSPRDRYQSVAEMEAALGDAYTDNTTKHNLIRFTEAVTDTEEVAPPPPGPKDSLTVAVLEHPKKFGHRTWQRVALGLSVLLISGILLSGWFTGDDDLETPRYSFYDYENNNADAGAGNNYSDPSSPLSKSTGFNNQLVQTTDTNSVPASATSEVSPAIATSDTAEIGEAAEIDETPETGDVSDNELAQGDAAPPEELLLGDTELTEDGDIDQLLALAQQSFNAYQLTTPREQSAVRYYRQVLSIDPDNQAAQQGLAAVTNKYAQLARQAINRSKYRSARRYIERGLSVDPNHRDLLALQTRTRATARTRSVNRPSNRRNRSNAAPPPTGIERILRDIFPNNNPRRKRPVGFNDK